MRRRVADLASLQHRHLAPYPVRSLAITSNDMQRPHSLTVKPRILRKALCFLLATFPPANNQPNLAHKHRYTLLHKIPHSPRIFVQVPTRKSLVCTIKERIVLFLFHQPRNLLPLLRCRINPRRIVRTRMKEENRLLRRLIQSARESRKVQPNRLGVIVRILHRRDANIFKYRMVIRYQKKKKEIMSLPNTLPNQTHPK